MICRYFAIWYSYICIGVSSSSIPDKELSQCCGILGLVITDRGFDVENFVLMGAKLNI